MLDDFTGSARRGTEINISQVALDGFKRDCDAWHIRDHGLHRSCYGSGISYIMAQVCPQIYSGDYQVNRLFKITKCGKRHTIRRSAVTGKSLRAVCQDKLTYPQRTVQRFNMSASRPVSIRGQDANLSKFTHFLRKCQ